MTLPVSKAPMHVPPMEEVAKVLQDGLQKNFSTVEVKVVDCPDLTEKPFHLSAKGICGSPRLADVGGPPFLLPLPQKDKLYDFGEIAKLVELPGAFIVGAGAGPWGVVGVNSELICSLQVNKDGTEAVSCNSHTAKIDTKDGSCILSQLKDTLNFNLMGNFLCSEGKPGKVLEIKASKRTGEENFMSAVRKTLHSHYKTKPVALGGVFLIEKGKANLHIMPDFSCNPLKSQAEVDGWLKFYEMDATLVCLGELVSYDPDLDLRVEHFHCFSDHGQGGHYHYDTTPNEVAYHAYFNIAETLYRIDQPPAANKPSQRKRKASPTTAAGATATTSATASGHRQSQVGPTTAAGATATTSATASGPTTAAKPQGAALARVLKVGDRVKLTPKAESLWALETGMRRGDTGTVTAIPSRIQAAQGWDPRGWVVVKWDSGREHTHAMGNNDEYHLTLS